MNYEEKVGNEILSQLLECNTTCVDLQGFHFEKPKDDRGIVDYYLKVLPGASYILGQQVNYIFSNGMTTGRVEGNNILDAFLYKNNERGETNYSVLQNAVKIASSYGECGVRWYEGDIYIVKPGTYATLRTVENGIEKIVGYITTQNGKSLGKDDFTFDDFAFDDEDITARFLEELEEREWIFLDKEDFVNVRNDTSYLHGKSPFLSDTLRLDLLVTAYERLIHDLNYDGPGRIILWAKQGLIGDEHNDIATSQVMKANPLSSTERNKKAKQELENITKDIKNSGSDSAILLSDVFDRNIQHLPRVTKATEFFDWINKEGIIVAQVLGMAPGLLELGEMSGNVSMEKIIDNAMLNTVVPLRERYAVQFSSLLAGKLGLEKIYFNKYELQQAEDENTMRTKVANIMAILNSIDTPETQELVRDFALMLNREIHQDGNVDSDLKELQVQKRREDYGKNGRNTETGGRS